jgi:hypothetical protein
MFSMSGMQRRQVMGVSDGADWLLLADFCLPRWSQSTRSVKLMVAESLLAPVTTAFDRPQRLIT